MIPKRVLHGAAWAALIVVAAWLADQRNSASPSGDAQGRDAKTSISRTAHFDYYLLTLSWSPTWCEAHPDDTEQCRRRGYGFILHGLWPQYDRGGGPQDCATGQRPDRTTMASTLAFMPSRGLIEHEWRAHGACSGLGPGDYFALADRAFASVRVPTALTAGKRPGSMNANAVRSAFVDANHALEADMLAVTCHSGTLSEVRICVDQDLQPRRCGRGVRMRCPANATLRIPLIR
jgi:ribonuclease T2